MHILNKNFQSIYCRIVAYASATITAKQYMEGGGWQFSVRT